MDKNNYKPYDESNDMCYFKNIYLRTKLEQIILLNDCPGCDGKNKKCGGYMGL